MPQPAGRVPIRRTGSGQWSTRAQTRLHALRVSRLVRLANRQRSVNPEAFPVGQVFRRPRCHRGLPRKGQPLDERGNRTLCVTEHSSFAARSGALTLSEKRSHCSNTKLFTILDFVWITFHRRKSGGHGADRYCSAVPDILCSRLLHERYLDTLHICLLLVVTPGEKGTLLLTGKSRCVIRFTDS